MKATTTDEAFAMKLSAPKMRHTVEDQENYGSANKEACLIIAENLEEAADAYLILEEIPERGVGGEFVQTTTGIKSSVICPSRNKVDRVNTEAKHGSPRIGPLKTVF